MKVLITGITGFVGSNIVTSFSSLNNFTVYGLDIIKPLLEGVDEIFEWDELEVIPDMDVIIHLAGKAHDTANTSKEQDYIDINYGLTKKIYDYFLQSSAKQFYLMSSVKAVADSVVGVLAEDVKPSPQTPYGKSKLLAEEYLLSIKPIDGKQVYIYRPCMVYGSGNKGNLNLLFKIVSKGIPWPLGSFNNSRSFFSVKNLSFVINEFIINNYESGIYHLSDDNPISTNNLINIIADVNNKKARILYIPKSLIRFIAKIGTVLHLTLTTERLNKLTESYIVSNEKLKKTIGKPLPVETVGGLMQTIRTFKVDMD
jgi:nucleoside-diphosphate-sugar epimerase